MNKLSSTDEHLPPIDHLYDPFSVDPHGIILPLHLGGHENRTNIDAGAFQFIKGAASITSMVDVGCGPGGMVKYAIDNGVEAKGIDGDFSIKTNLPIHIHDFTQGYVQLDKIYDLCWCVEFVEHVEEQFIENFIKVFQQCRFLLMTHAIPGQGGHHHVNEQPYYYWVKKMTEAGFIFEPQVTNMIKQHSTMSKPSFIELNGLFFRNGRI